MQERRDTGALCCAASVEVEGVLAHGQQEDLFRTRRGTVENFFDGGVQVFVPMRLPAVGIPDAVVPCEVPAGQRLARLATGVRVGGERGDDAPDEQRRLGESEVCVLLDGVSPILFADAEVVEHGLGAQKARGQGNCG